MAEDHSKYMPHHPKPKYAGGNMHPKLHDTMLRPRNNEPTSHDGSGGVSSGFGDYAQGGYFQNPEQSNAGQSAPDAGMF